MRILVVGSSVIDIFLKTDPRHSQITNNKVSFLLGDKIPSEIGQFSIGGNGANLSIGLKKLGFDISFFTYLSNDVLSTQIEKDLQQEGIDLVFQRINSNTPSMSLVFDFKDDRIIFSHHLTYDYDFFYKEGLPSLVYLTSIGNRWEKAYEKVIGFAKENNIPIALSPGSAQMENINETLINTIKSSSLLLINKSEAEKILEKINIKKTDIYGALLELQKIGPETVSITDGKNGSYAIDKTQKSYKIESFKKAGGGAVKDRTGAGDSYASGFIAAYLQKKDLADQMLWGAINAWAVMQKIGAQNGLLSKTDMEKIASDNNFSAKIVK